MSGDSNMLEPTESQKLAKEKTGAELGVMLDAALAEMTAATDAEEALLNSPEAKAVFRRREDASAHLFIVRRALQAKVK